MKRVRALVDCYVCGAFRKGAEMDIDDNLVGDGEIFEVPDDYEINPDILQLLDPHDAAPASAAGAGGGRRRVDRKTGAVESVS